MKAFHLVTFAWMVIVSMSINPLWKCKVEHGYERTYTYDEGYWIGPTETGTRLPNPQASPTDLNSIYLAPNGNDGGAGTQAAPKLTIPGAFAALGGGKTNVQVIRNGYVGEIIFTMTATATLLFGNTMQVETGEMAKIVLAASFITLNLQGSTINGFDITTDSGFFITGSATVTASGGTSTIQNCSLRNLSASGGPQVLGNTAGNSTILSNSIIYQDNPDTTDGYNPASLGGSGSIENCIVFGNGDFEDESSNVPSDTISNGNNIGISLGAGPAGNSVINNVIFVNVKSAVRGVTGQSTLANAHTHVFTNCVFDNVKYFILTTAPAAPGTYYYKLDFVNCYVPAFGNAVYIKDGFAGPLFATEVVKTETDNISLSLPPLFRDQSAGRLLDIEGYKLQIRGAPIGDAVFPLTSPLYQSGFGGESLGPWQEEVTDDGVSFTKATTLSWAPTGFKLSKQFINPQVKPDIRGDSHVSSDGSRWVFEFSYPGAGEYTSINEFRKIAALYEETSAMRFYPIYNSATDSANLFLDPETGNPIATSGAFVADTDDPLRGTFTMSPIPDVDIKNARVLFWMILSDSSEDYHLMIEANEDGVYSLVDIIQSPSQIPPDGDYDFTIEYILVIPDVTSPLDANQEKFSQFLAGGSLGDFQIEAISATAEWPYSGWIARFIARATLGQ